MIPTKPKTPRCHVCLRPISGARCTVKGQWTCGDCVYEAEYGPVERPSKPEPGRRRPPQEEQLFVSGEAGYVESAGR